MMPGSNLALVVANRVNDGAIQKWKTIVEIACVEDLRLGELWNLELEDVVLEAPIPHLAVRYGAAGHLPTKAGRPRRVPLVGPALDATRKWMAQLDLTFLAYSGASEPSYAASDVLPEILLPSIRAFEDLLTAVGAVNCSVEVTEEIEYGGAARTSSYARDRVVSRKRVLVRGWHPTWTTRLALNVAASRWKNRSPRRL